MKFLNSLSRTVAIFIFVILVQFLFFPTTTVFAATISVDDGTSTVANNGLCSLREAITNANNGDQSGSTDCTAGSGITDTILLGVNVTLTVIDNTTEGNNGLPSIESPIILGGQGNTLERSNAISDTFRILHVASSGTLQLYNITISNGSAQDTDGGISTDDDGGGIFIRGAVTVTNSTLSDNSADFGGGIYTYLGGSVTVTSSTLSDNSASVGGGGIASNGMATVTHSTISGNSAGNNGGGIANSSSSGTVTVTNSTISGNSANHGGGITNYGTTTVTNSILSGNSADNGGGIRNSTDDIVTVTNSILSGNSADNGGGIYDSGTATVTNSTVSGNSATNGGGFYVSGSGSKDLINSIVWGNRASSSGHQAYLGASNSITITSSGIEGGTGAYGGSCCPVDGGGNIELSSSDDIFVNPISATLAPTTAGDYHLTSTSVVINQGDQTLLPADTLDIDNDGNPTEPLPLDIDGNDRVIGGEVDMGADELILPPVNTNLIYNPGFTLGANNDAGWRFYGSIQHNVVGGRMKLNFPTSVNGWMRQFRTQFPLQPGLRMVGYVTVSNQDPGSKNFQVIFRDSDLSNTFLCNFSIPDNTWNKVYYMRFITGTNWEIIRVDIRPNEVDANGLRFDNVNLRYRPWLTFTEKECISPTFSDETPTPPETELIANAPANPPSVYGGNEGDENCTALDWSDTANWNGYLPTSEVQFVFDPFPDGLVTAKPLQNLPSVYDPQINLPSVYGGTEGGNIFDANGDGEADTLYDALSYNGDPASSALIREAVIAMLNDRTDANHPEAWWAVEIDTAEALAQGENAMLELAQQYALSNSRCG